MHEDFPLFVQVPAILRNSTHGSYVYRVVSADLKKLRDFEVQNRGAKFYSPPRGHGILKSKSKPMVDIAVSSTDELRLTKINAEYSMVVQWIAKEEWFRQCSGTGMTKEAQAKFDSEILAKIRILLYNGAWEDEPKTEEGLWLNEHIQNRVKLRENLDRVLRYPLKFSSKQDDTSFRSLLAASREDDQDFLPPVYETTQPEEVLNVGKEPSQSFAEYMKRIQNGSK